MILVEINELTFSSQIDDSLRSVWFLTVGFLTDYLFLLRKILLFLQLLLLKILHKDLIFLRQTGDRGRRRCQRTHTRHLLGSRIQLVMILTTHIESLSLAVAGYHGALGGFGLLMGYVWHHMGLMCEGLLCCDTSARLLWRLLSRRVALYFAELD